MTQALSKAKQAEEIKDDGIPLYKPGLEAVQFADHPWYNVALSARNWGYEGIQLSNFHLDPKALVETDLAEEVHQTLSDMSAPGLPIQLSGYSTHCAMIGWGYAQHPGSLAFVTADEDTKAKMFGKPNEIKAWMWDNVVQYIPEATAKLGLTTTHTFIPPPVVGAVKGLEHAGALIPMYNFVMCNGVPMPSNEGLKDQNIAELAIDQLGNTLDPFLDSLKKHEVTASHEIHFDTMAKGPNEYLYVLERLGDKAKDTIYLGMDNSHAWQGEPKPEWYTKVSDRIRNLHIKNSNIVEGKPVITAQMGWLDRGMHFTGPNQGGYLIEDQLDDVAMYTDFHRHPTFKDEKPAGLIDDIPVYTKFATGEGEHPKRGQVNVAKQYAKVLAAACDRTYGSGFRVGGQQG